MADYIFAFNNKKNIPKTVWNNKKLSCIIKGLSTKIMVLVMESSIKIEKI